MYLDYPTFVSLYIEARQYTDIDLYIAERGWQEWMNDFSENDIVEILNAVYSIGKMTMAEIRKAVGCSSRAEMSRKYRIPLRTLESWDYGDKEPRSMYVYALIAYTYFVSIMHVEENKSDITKQD